MQFQDGDLVVMKGLYNHVEYDMGTVLCTCGDEVTVRWQRACNTYTECSDDLRLVGAPE